MSGKQIRNIIIALVLLVILLVEPFWGSIKGAITGEDAQTGATTEVAQITCTVAVTCQSVWEHLDRVTAQVLDGLPEDGQLLPETEVTVSQGATVLEALQAAARAAGLSVGTADGSDTVERIGDLANGDAGEGSGWTCTCNGAAIPEPVAVQTVAQGDQVVWSYGCTEE